VIIGCYIELVAHDPYTSGNADSLPVVDDVSTDADIVAAIDAAAPNVNIYSVSDEVITGSGIEVTDEWRPV